LGVALRTGAGTSHTPAKTIAAPASKATKRQQQKFKKINADNEKKGKNSRKPKMARGQTKKKPALFHSGKLSQIEIPSARLSGCGSPRARQRPDSTTS
jgi:hypothetical protein